MGVRATGLQSFKHAILFFFGMGTMVDFFEAWGNHRSPLRTSVWNTLQNLSTPLCRHQTLPGTCPSPRDQNSPVLMVMCWKYFGAIVLKLALLKSPVTINAASGYAVSCSLIFPYSSLSAWSVLAWGGMYTAVIMIAVNSLGSQNGRHRSIWNSRSGDQKDLIEYRFLSSHHELLIKKQMPPPLLFPVSSFVLSERCTDNPVSSMAESGTTADIHVSVRQIMQQSLVSRWYEMRARNSQSLLSSDWMLANKMVGSGGRRGRRLSLTRTPALFPLFLWRFLGFDHATQTKGSDAVSVNKAPAFKMNAGALFTDTASEPFVWVARSKSSEWLITWINHSFWQH